MNKYVTKNGNSSKRINLYIDENLYEEAKKYVKNFSEFFSKGLKNYIDKCSKNDYNKNRLIDSELDGDSEFAHMSEEELAKEMEELYNL